MSMTQIVIVTAGSRGDVQPYVALGKGLHDAGYQVRIVATHDFETLITGQGLDFHSTGASVQEILQDETLQKKLEGANFLAQQKHMRAEAMRHAPRIAESMITASQDADLIIGGIGVMGGGLAIAENNRIPCIHAHVFPLTPTRAFASPITPNLPLGRWLNRPSYWLVQQALWQTSRTSDSEVRQQLGMKSAPFLGYFNTPTMRDATTLYGYSTYVLPKPDDWNEHHHVTGYWFLDAEDDWQPPQDLLDFLEAGAPPVYIGFGSMRSQDAEATGALALEALRRSGQRGVLASGWGGLSPSDLPDDVFMLSSIPHSWLFPRMAAVVHHGGAGTTSAGLRAGVPSIVIPFMGDQRFWGEKVKRLGVGSAPIPRKKLTVEQLANAIKQVTSDEGIKQRAHALGEKIRAEDGVPNAVKIIQHTLAQAIPVA
jgi:sterol 3beta-glucosyltransferase